MSITDKYDLRDDNLVTGHCHIHTPLLHLLLMIQRLTLLEAAFNYGSLVGKGTPIKSVKTPKRQEGGGVKKGRR